MSGINLRNCAFCGRQFTVMSKHPDVKLCSVRCASLSRRTIPDGVCAKCGKSFRPKRASARWCSRLCAGQKQATHRLSTTRGYAIWAKMLNRCYRKENDNYKFYGGLGIYVCKRWRESVQAFIDDMGQPPGREFTLDRINTYGNYTCGKCNECRETQQPANCRWATKATQFRNIKKNRWFTHEGKTLILKDWATLLNLNYHALWVHIFRRKLTFADAIRQPPPRVRRMKRSLK